MNNALHPTRQEPVEIEKASLSQLLELIGTTVVFDKETTQVALNRL